MRRDKLTRMAIGMGAIAGMRSMVAPSILSEYLKTQPKEGLNDSKLSFVRSTVFARIAEILAAGEMAADKSSQIPDRISALSLTGRVITGLLVGATTFTFGKKDPVQGALIGGSMALVSTFASFYLRKAINENTTISNKALGLAEDAIVVGGALALKETSK